MAIEFVSITPGTGKDIAVDTIAAVEYQVVKLALGADGAMDNLVDSGQQVMAASVPVALASDQSALPVTGPVTDTQLRATAVPVSLASVPSHAVTNAGTFAVQAAATLAAETTKVIGTVNVAAGQTIAATGPITDTQLRASAVPVSVASVPSHAVTNAGTFAVQAAATLAAETTKVIGTVNIAASQSVQTAENGKTRISLRVAVTASQTGATVWDPTAGKKFVLTHLEYSATGAGTVQLFDATDSGNTVVTGIMSIAANGGFMRDWPMEMPYRSATADNILKYTSGAGAAGSIYVEGWEE